MILRETVQSHSSKGIDAMTTAHDIDWPQALAERLTWPHFARWVTRSYVRPRAEAASLIWAIATGNGARTTTNRWCKQAFGRLVVF